MTVKHSPELCLTKLTSPVRGSTSLVIAETHAMIAQLRLSTKPDMFALARELMAEGNFVYAAAVLDIASQVTKNR